MTREKMFKLEVSYEIPKRSTFVIFHRYYRLKGSPFPVE